MKDLEQRFAGRGVKQGGILMFQAPDALAFIEAARQQQRPVLGVDSFIVTATATQPMIEHILDLSAGGLLTDTWSQARHFVEERSDLGFLFEIVI